MAFNTVTFLFFFLPTFFLFYFYLPMRNKNALILAFSLFFYAWAEPIFVFIVFISAIVDYFLGPIIAKATAERIRKLVLALSIVKTLSFLIYFKYAEFLYLMLEDIIGADILPGTGPSPALPLAISFVTFEKITYVVDLYRRKGKPATSLVNYLTYIFLFPKLIAGPIIKYHDIETQLSRHSGTREDILQGFARFALGLAKKVLLADVLATIADTAFGTGDGDVTFRTAWLGTLFFTLQIYLDFSAYSDMAIGLSRMMGFRLKENFNNPYLADSFTDFWRRWHISLSTWIKEYLYIPLGGNRVPAWRSYINLGICFFLSGLWHGANYTFIVWGLFHGTFLIFDRLSGTYPQRFVPTFIRVGLTFFLVMISWIIFRAQSLDQAWLFIQTLFRPSMTQGAYVIVEPLHWRVLTISLCLVLLPVFMTYVKRFDGWLEFKPVRIAKTTAFGIGIGLLFLYGVARVATTNFQPFLYFQF